jgi:hypothetical protein
MSRSGPKLVQTLIWTMGRSYRGRRSRVCIDASAEQANVCTEPHIQHRRPTLVQTLIGTMGRSYGGRRSRERIDARAARANMRAAPHIHHMRPNGWVDRGPNWYKHSFWTMGRSYGGRRSRVCIDARAEHAHVRTASPIQHWRPKGWTD